MPSERDTQIEEAIKLLKQKLRDNLNNRPDYGITLAIIKYYEEMRKRPFNHH